ncbi:unnamed protein product [Cylindrotheca closterium]|uniref:Uncharacterized protein n=1 Tax=Cylindrotheca closterium TaxID=2856 RepID=A0AAD2FLJ2_9STRA|nr:unnamed protein product [Cylindrotheca closterium]
MDESHQKIEWFIYKGQPIREIPRNVTHVLVDPSMKEIEDGAFKNCKDLLSVVVPSTVLQIGKRAFEGCRHLSHVQLHEGIRGIGDRAFASCALVDLHLPHGLRSIGNYAFARCPELRAISVPASVEWIGCHTFSSCVALVQVHLQRGLKNIGHSAFDRCLQLAEIELPEGLERIDARLFRGCRSLTTLSMPSTVKTIGFAALENCPGLVHVYLHEGLKCIGKSAFAGCRSLCGITLPSSLEVIDNDAFRECLSLLGVELPSDIAVTTADDCFDECSALVNVAFPPSVDPWCVQMLLKGRYEITSFEGLPIHKLCYNSTHTTTRELEELLMSPGILEASKSKDVRLMTPFHIVATSPNLRADILECLLERYPTDMLLRQTDSFNNTMMDYLLKHKSNKAVQLIGMVLYKVLVESISGWDTKARDRFYLSDDERPNLNDSERRQELLEGMVIQVGFYTGLETRLILDLALWKMKISLLEVDSENLDTTDRTSCRYRFGADDLIKGVVGYLWGENCTRHSTALATYPKLDFYPTSDPESTEFDFQEWETWEPLNDNLASNSDSDSDYYDSLASESDPDPDPDSDSSSQSDSGSYYSYNYGSDDSYNYDL